MKLFLDMDGCIVDFLGGAARAHGRLLPYGDPKWRGLWNTEEAWGISSADFWKPINADPTFWYNLDKTIDADQIVASCVHAVGIKNIAILTSPDRSANCFLGKIDWIKRYYPQLEGRMIFGRAKEFMASPERILVDDKDANVDEFRKADGKACLIPRLWNSDHVNADRATYCVEEDLKAIMMGAN